MRRARFTDRLLQPASRNLLIGTRLRWSAMGKAGVFTLRGSEHRFGGEIARAAWRLLASPGTQALSD